VVYLPCNDRGDG